MAERGTTKEHLEYAADLIDRIKDKAPVRLLDHNKELIKRDFEANGTRYVVLKHEDIFNVGRMKAHLLLEQMFAHAKSLEELAKANVKSVELFDKMMTTRQGAANLGVHLENIRKNFFADGLRRDHIAFYQCTLFIVPIDSDYTQWSLDKADKCIEDWTKANIYAPDIFFLALKSYPNFMKLYKQLTEITLDETEKDGSEKDPQAKAKGTENGESEQPLNESNKEGQK